MNRRGFLGGALAALGAAVAAPLLPDPRMPVETFHLAVEEVKLPHFWDERMDLCSRMAREMAEEIDREILADLLRQSGLM